jgi:hypothetical protein
MKRPLLFALTMMMVALLGGCVDWDDHDRGYRDHRDHDDYHHHDDDRRY